MTLIGALFGLLVATLCGLGFHLLFGGSIRRLVLFVSTAWISFFVGHFLGMLLKWEYWRLGSINFFASLLATVLGLTAALILAGPETSNNEPQA